jgi:hypothetical protein
MASQLFLPPKSVLRVTAPSNKNQQQGSIEKKNPFVKLSIKTRLLSQGVGLGEYGMMNGISVDEGQKQFWGYDYEVQVTAKFNRWRTGHPHMPLYKKWASQVISELQEELDEERIVERAREQFIFMKNAGKLGAEPFPMRIMSFSPPERH